MPRVKTLISIGLFKFMAGHDIGIYNQELTMAS